VSHRLVAVRAEQNNLQPPLNMEHRPYYSGPTQPALSSQPVIHIDAFRAGSKFAIRLELSQAKFCPLTR
jgi:hypothetical protein